MLRKFSDHDFRVQLTLVSAGAALALIVSLLFLRSMVLAVCLALVVSAAIMQLLRARRMAKELAHSRLIPDLTEILAGGLEAGLSLVECVEELTRHRNPVLIDLGHKMAAVLDSNLPTSQKLNRCSKLVSCREGDLLFQLIESAMHFGDRNLGSAMLGFAKRTRELHSLQEELDSRLGWIRGTVTLAQFTPWIVVVLLSLRPEAASAYASPVGAALLLGGLVATQFAGRLISLASTRSAAARIFQVGGLLEGGRSDEHG